MKILIKTNTRLREFSDFAWAGRYKEYLRSRKVDFQEYLFRDADLKAGRKLADIVRVTSLQLGGRMKYQLKTIGEKPQTFDIDVFPRPAMVLEFSKNINKEVEVYVQLDDRKYRLYDTRWYRQGLSMGQKCPTMQNQIRQLIGGG